MGRSMSPEAVRELIEADAGWSVTCYYDGRKIVVSRRLAGAAAPEIAGWVTTGALTSLLSAEVLDYGEYVTGEDGSEARKVFRLRGVLCYCVCGHLLEKHRVKAGLCTIEGCNCKEVDPTE